MNGKVLIARDDFLSHHGTDGMRWGVRNGPPYPLTKEGRAAIRKQRQEKKAAQKAEAERKLQIKKEKEEAAFKAKKEKLIMGASASEVMKHQGEWTNEELSRIATRLDLEAKINSKIPRKETALDKLYKYGKYAEQISKFSKSATSVWNDLQRMYNSSKKKDNNNNKKKDNKNNNQNNDNNKKKKNKNKLQPTSKTEKWKNNWDWDYDWGK